MSPRGTGGNHSSSTALPAQPIVWMKHSQQRNTFIDFADVVQRSCVAMSGKKAFTELMVPVLVILMLVCNLNSVWGFCLVLSLCRLFYLPVNELFYHVCALPLILRKLCFLIPAILWPIVRTVCSICGTSVLIIMSVFPFQGRILQQGFRQAWFW